MQSATVPCTSNGIKRTAANAMLSDNSLSSSSSSFSNHDENYHSNISTLLSTNQSISPPPPEKRSFIVIESPLKLETIASAEDLDIKVLRIQNKNLSEKLIQRQKLESELREKINILQNRKLADDNKICVVDRYWTQLDEDLRIILERFDNENSKLTGSETTSLAAASSGKSSLNKNKENNSSQQQQLLKSSSQSVRNFLAKLNDWDKVEIEENLKERVKFTTQTVAKLITNYDRMGKKIEQYFKELNQAQNSRSHEKLDTSHNLTSVNAASYNENRVHELYEENCRLNEVLTKCQQKNHSVGLENKQLEDQIATLENELKDFKSKNDEIEYELEKTRDKAFKLDRQLAESLVKFNNLQKITNNSTINNSNNATTISNHIDQNGHITIHNHNFSQNKNDKMNNANTTDKQISEIEADLEEQKKLAASRLQELEELNTEYQNSLKQIEKLKADLKLMPDSVIEQTNEYKMLQTKYSLVVNDNIKLKQALDESKSLLEMSRVTFQRQLEQMESEELIQQKRLGNEMMQLEEQLTQVRKENELLRIEFEQNIAANEQTGPINKEMRSLITTLQTNNKLLKSDNTRTKKRLDELQIENERLKKQVSQLQSQFQATSNVNVNKKENDSSSKIDSKLETETVIKMEPNFEIKNEDDSISSKDLQLKELKEQNRKLIDTQKDLKNQLENLNKLIKHQQSPSTNSNYNNKKITELEDAKLEIKRLKESLEKYKSSAARVLITNQSVSSANATTSSTTATASISTTGNIMSPSTNTSHSFHHHHHQHDDHSLPNSSQLNDQIKKMKSLEETIRELQKNLNSKKQEEAALLNDMEITGQAFEDMQEQNVRLMQQLREKDDANFKLVSERIKLENMQKILKEEKEIYVQQALTLQDQLEAQMAIAKRLEEQFQLATQTIVFSEKEIAHLQQSCENYKRQLIDNSQLIQDLKLNTQKYLIQLKEVQQQITEKSEALASQSFVNKRSQEEIKHLQTKLERQKKFEMASNMDEVLKEEIKEYKEQLRCPSCKVKQKDAVLTKCFHVFCFDCLQKRYDTRQRKCPKCNANFGANDFRKLYLS